jgi:hypothetical protein
MSVTSLGGWRQVLAIGAPSVLLVIVAANQMVLARTMQLSPWKGGGFGMFASVDGLPFRHVRLYVSAPDRSEELTVPPSLAGMAASTATFPRRGSLERLGEAVIAREHRHGRAADSVRVEVWRASYSSTLEASWMRVVGLTVTAHEAASVDR